MPKRIFLLICCYLVSYIGVSQKRKDNLVTISTKFGDMHLVLFNETPKHKANFLKLINEKFYDSLLFHRVIPNFMIQGGDPESKNAKPNNALGGGSLAYKIPAEINSTYFHQTGALAAALDDNPENASSGCQFYIVHGKIWNEKELEAQILRSGRKFTDEQKKIYTTLGGSAHLDGNYTVFGQLVSGLNVLDSIANQPKNSRNRPNTNVLMKIKTKPIRKKKITKMYGYQYVKEK